MAAGMDILRRGGTAIDAVEAASRIVEDNLDDHSVGTGGFPNSAGEVELDASLMDGTTRRAGAVAALKNYPYPISVARAVMEHLPRHLLLVGEGAALFAAAHGFETRDLLTDAAAQAFQEKKFTLSGEEYAFDGTDVKKNTEHVYGTVDFLAQDSKGQIASAVTTSGWAFKHPGRVGDSPLIGAGNYCDDRYGACACTGLGEWSIRASTARTVVLAMQLGMSLDDACVFAFQDLFSIPVPPPIDPVMSFVALDKNGAHAGYSTTPGRTYVWQTADMPQFETQDRVIVTPG